MIMLGLTMAAQNQSHDDILHRHQDAKYVSIFDQLDDCKEIFQAKKEILSKLFHDLNMMKQLGLENARLQLDYIINLLDDNQKQKAKACVTKVLEKVFGEKEQPSKNPVPESKDTSSTPTHIEDHGNSKFNENLHESSDMLKSETKQSACETLISKYPRYKEKDGHIRKDILVLNQKFYENDIKLIQEEINLMSHIEGLDAEIIEAKEKKNALSDELSGIIDCLNELK